jgi:hypothetical protein
MSASSVDGTDDKIMISIRLPLYTVSEKNHGSDRGRFAQARRVRQQRGIVCMALTPRLLSDAPYGWHGKTGTARLRVTLTRYSPGVLDDDNLQRALSAVRDGVADALGVKDNDKRLSFRYAQEKVKRFTAGRVPASKYAVRIEIESADDKEDG